MAKAFIIPFPIRGQDAGWAYNRQPPETTPDASNVRAYSTDKERARGGQRPGLKYAYPKRVGGSAAANVAFLGWLDTGFGDSEVYAEEFNYAAGSLSGVTNGSGTTTWKNAAAPLQASAGYVKLSGPTVSQSAGNYQNLAGDTWDDFEFEATVAWNVGTSGQVIFWINSTGAGATDGAKVTFDLTSTWITAPGLGFTQSVNLTLDAEGGGTTHTARWSRYWPMLITQIRTVLLVKATKETVKLFWGGQEVASVNRPTPDTDCTGFGFSMSMTNPAGSPLPDSMVSLRVEGANLIATSRAGAITRKAVAVGGRDLYYESSGGTTFAAVNTADNFPAVSLVSGAHCNGQMYFVTGSTCIRFNANDNTVHQWDAKAGKIERDCRIVVNWRNRLVLADSIQNPHVLYMSRIDDPFDWDYAKDDPESATYSAQFEMGRVGDPVKALCPLSDDVLVVGTSRAVWALEGDPMAGGRLTLRADDVGMLSQNAWCADENGNLYWLSYEGLYAMSAGGRPKLLSGTRIPGMCVRANPAETGSTAAAGDYYYTVLHDFERHGIVIAQTPHTAGAATVYFYDLRTGGFWPETYPQGVGPMCGAFYNSTATERKRLLLGGRNGVLYAYDDDRKYDEAGSSATGSTTSGTTATTTLDAGGTANVDSYALVGPLGLGGAGRPGVAVKTIATMSGATGGTVDWNWRAEDTPEALVAGADKATFTVPPGRTIHRERVRGAYHAIKIVKPAGSTNRTWAFENAIVEAQEGGDAR